MSLPQNRLSEHFTLDELTDSSYAESHGIPNVPTPAEVENLKRLCNEVLEPIRMMVACPISISSGFRSGEVNEAVGGSASSQHCLGEAADINAKNYDCNRLWWMIAVSDLKFGQCILEDLDGKHWVHVSTGDKCELMMTNGKKNGKVNYARYQRCSDGTVFPVS